MIGREGMVGVPVALGIDRSPHTIMVETPGAALCIPAQGLRAVMPQSPAIREHFLRYAHVLMVQTAQTAFANASFTIEARLARRVLMTQDRLDQDDLPLTHEFLSMMLGVRRPGVTLAIQALEGNGLIRAKRGSITVLDRTKLEEVADDAYGLAEAEYARVMEKAGRAVRVHEREPALV